MKITPPPKNVRDILSLTYANYDKLTPRDVLNILREKSDSDMISTADIDKCQMILDRVIEKQLKFNIDALFESGKNKYIYYEYSVARDR